MCVCYIARCLAGQWQGQDRGRPPRLRTKSHPQELPDGPREAQRNNPSQHPQLRAPLLPRRGPG
jgi:hypothetical protein